MVTAGRRTPWRHSVWVRGAGLGLGLGVAINLGILAAGAGTDAPGAADPGPINRLIQAIVPFVWLGLFAAMATAILILRALGRGAALPAAAAMLLLVNCALYPVYTLGFQSMPLGLAGNIFTAILAAFAAGAAARLSPLAAALLLPVTIWVSLAAIGLVAVMTGGQF
ncbi:MAG: tryptophan-rich sensory protein [Sphingomonadales bacterium]|jgi:tryptophan-rich sensory protein